MSKFDNATQTALSMPETEEPQATVTASDSTDSAEGAATLLTDTGLLNVDAIEDEAMKSAAGAINEIVQGKLTQLEQQLQSANEHAQKAQSFDALVKNPNAIKQLYEQTFGSTAGVPPVAAGNEDNDELEGVSVDTLADPEQLQRIVRTLARRTNSTPAKAMQQLEQKLLSAIDERLTPLTKAIGAQQAHSRWATLVSQHPEAESAEYRNEIARVLGTGRCGRDDYEFAFNVADSVLRRRRETVNKAQAVVTKTKGVRAAQAANPSAGKKVQADALQEQKPKGSARVNFGNAVQVAIKKHGEPKA